MKKFRILLMAVAALVLLSSVNAEAQSKKSQKKEVEIMLSIPDLDCPN